MAMTLCPKCNTPVSSRVKVCPSCEYPVFWLFAQADRLFKDSRSASKKLRFLKGLCPEPTCDGRLRPVDDGNDGFTFVCDKCGKDPAK